MEMKVTKALLQCPLFEGLTADKIEQAMGTISYRLAAIQKFSLQRCLNELAAEGTILLDGKHITIVDRQKLK